MEINIKADPKEIAALVLEIQERQLSELKEGICVDSVPMDGITPVRADRLTDF